MSNAIRAYKIHGLRDYIFNTLGEKDGGFELKLPIAFAIHP